MEPRPDGRGKWHLPVSQTPTIETPQWSPGLMAGGSPGLEIGPHARRREPQWSPGLMAGGRLVALRPRHPCPPAAMEPRPDGRGKAALKVKRITKNMAPQWSPGLMAGGSRPCRRAGAVAVVLAAMEPRPDGRGKVTAPPVSAPTITAAMEPRPDGRGKVKAHTSTGQRSATPQWSPGLMAGGSPTPITNASTTM